MNLKIEAVYITNADGELDVEVHYILNGNRYRHLLRGFILDAWAPHPPLTPEEVSKRTAQAIRDTLANMCIHISSDAIDPTSGVPTTKEG